MTQWTLERLPSPAGRVEGSLSPWHGLPETATPGQRDAFAALLHFCSGRGVAPARILSGYAGTGKTWLTVQIVQALSRHGLRVAVCAPTHKAVSVIAAKIDDHGGSNAWIGTLHSLLGLKLTETHDGSMHLKLDRRHKIAYFEDFDVVIIDEASMVGSLLLSYVNRFGGSKPRILYVGDPGQLLPVEPETADGAPENDLPLLAPVLMDGAVDARSCVFRQTADCWRLTEVVRQRSTGQPHPIVEFAQELRRYIEGEVDGVFGPDEIRAYLSGKDDLFRSAVRTADAGQIGHGAVSLRQRHPHKDIRVVCWRNLVVDERNRSIHLGLAALYGVSDLDGTRAPFWPGEILVAREALYGFPVKAQISTLGEDSWRRALSPDPDLRGASLPEDLVLLIPNNTEMVVRSCEPIDHPYLRIPSWRIRVDLPDGGEAEVFAADQPQKHRKLVSDTWSAYRHSERNNDAFRHAWAVTRACAPVMHAYAMTAHKAQGSTFHYSLVDVSDLCGMLHRAGADAYHRALYVAVTRASERVWLCF